MTYGDVDPAQKDHARKLARQCEAHFVIVLDDGHELMRFDAWCDRLRRGYDGQPAPKLLWFAGKRG